MATLLPHLPMPETWELSLISLLMIIGIGLEMEGQGRVLSSTSINLPDIFTLNCKSNHITLLFNIIYQLPTALTVKSRLINMTQSPFMIPALLTSLTPTSPPNPAICTPYNFPVISHATTPLHALWSRSGGFSRSLPVPRTPP